MERNIALLRKENVHSISQKWGPGQRKVHGTVSGQCFFHVSTL